MFIVYALYSCISHSKYTFVSFYCVFFVSFFQISLSFFHSVNSSIRMLATSILAGHNQISRSARNLLAQHSTILKSVHAARQYQHLTSAHCCNSSPPNHPTTSSPLKSCHVLCSSPHSCKQLNGTRRFNSIRQQVHKQQRKVSWGTQSWTDKDLSNLLSAKRAISTSAWRSNPRGVNQRSGRRHEEILEEEESDRETDVAKEEEADTRTRPHVPVMANEVLDALEPDENQVCFWFMLFFELYRDRFSSGLVF